jgi:hypothetical protein
MSRKSITWIAVGALAAAAVVVAALVAYHVGADHGSSRIAVGPLRRSFVMPLFVRTVRPFPAAEALLLLLIGGVIGAAIAVLARPGGAVAGHPALAAPVDPRWSEFDQWHQWAHGAPTVAPQAASAPPATATAPPDAPVVTPAAPTDSDAGAAPPPAPPTGPA